jgi:hypothetical protein
MTDNVIVRAPVTVANLTAEAGVTTTVGGGAFRLPAREPEL